MNQNSNADDDFLAPVTPKSMTNIGSADLKEAPKSLTPAKDSAKTAESVKKTVQAETSREIAPEQTKRMGFFFPSA